MKITIAFEGFEATLDIENPWAVLEHAHGQTQLFTHTSQGDVCKECLEPANEQCENGSKASQIREIAKNILADGRLHERREILTAVRKAGLTPGHLDPALKSGGFDKVTNAGGRPAYRDPSVPSPYKAPEPILDEDKPAWMRNQAPANGSGGIAKLGTLGTNGGAT